MKRRKFIQVTFAAAPFFLATSSSQEVIASKTQHAVRVKSGADRFELPTG